MVTIKLPKLPEATEDVISPLCPKALQLHASQNMVLLYVRCYLWNKPKTVYLFYGANYFWIFSQHDRCQQEGLHLRHHSNTLVNILKKKNMQRHITLGNGKGRGAWYEKLLLLTDPCTSNLNKFQLLTVSCLLHVLKLSSYHLSGLFDWVA